MEKEYTEEMKDSFGKSVLYLLLWPVAFPYRMILPFERDAVDLMAKLILADGAASEVEKEEAYRQISQHYDLVDRWMAKRALKRALRQKEALKVNYPMAYCRSSKKLVEMYDYYDRLQMLISLFEIAAADCAITAGEFEVIEHYAETVRIKPEDWLALKEKYEENKAGLVRYKGGPVGENDIILTGR